ncbi:vegetative cell wall protein gp1-like [Lynx rufus]|uniref:vegetative cell wall protein gp1-like n=1 Tax=Lynx rufus TaxID=61384 RepID=UPI001F1275F0|nr:vegetative cell wall protein gp1-like [Lynx rufus]
MAVLQEACPLLAVHTQKGMQDSVPRETAEPGTPLFNAGALLEPSTEGARSARSARPPEPPTQGRVSASTAHPGCASRNLPPFFLGHRTALSLFTPPPRNPPAPSPWPPPSPQPRTRPQPGGSEPARRPPAGVPHSPSRTPRRRPREAFLPHLARPRLPSASLPLPAAPPLPRGFLSRQDLESAPEFLLAGPGPGGPMKTQLPERPRVRSVAPREDFCGSGSPARGKGADWYPGDHHGKTMVPQIRTDNITALHTGDLQMQSRHLENRSGTSETRDLHTRDLPNGDLRPEIPRGETPIPETPTPEIPYQGSKEKRPIEQGL